jgi:nucleotide-binding universal stress UspA family protein
MSKIIVGVDQSDGSNDAIALASSLAGITGAEVMLVNVFPYDIRPSRMLNAEFEAYLRQDSNELLERLLGELDLVAETKAIANPSPARGLHELAEQEDAALIVVGSTHTGRAGRVLPGSTAERLLHGSPCPVAVAPKGYTPGAEPGIVGCGFDGSQSAQRALQAAEQIAAATGARLRVIRAFQPLRYDYPPKGVPMGGTAYNDKLQARASEELDAAVAALQGTVRAEKFFAVGNAGEILAGATEELDLLLVGSRGYGPLHSVVVGGVAGRVVRDAACPVIVLPRKARHVAGDSLFAEAVPLPG